MKKFLTYPVFVIVIISIIFSILYGALLRHHYLGFGRVETLRNIAVFFAEIPSTLKFIVINKTLTGDTIEPLNNFIYENKEAFELKREFQKINELIVISRHDGDLGKSVVEIRDMNTFEIIHKYLPDIEKIYQNIDLTKEDFKNLKRDKGLNRFYMRHPAITSKGELIFQNESPLIKIDLNSKIIWVNDEDKYHHSINLDKKNNIYVPSYKYPFSKTINNMFAEFNINEDDIYFYDDAINIIDQNGNIFYSKSVAELLIENNLKHRIFSQSIYHPDPIHLNDIEPVLEDGPYFKKNDLFLSIRNLSLVLLYRPETNKIIHVIEGSFFNQHDVDILDEKRISIYNNNVFLLTKDNKRRVKYNEIIIYNFETDTFSKKFDKTLNKYNVNTPISGLVDFLSDGSAMIEDRTNGRILYLDKEGNLLWEFYNLDSNKKVYDLFWARILDPIKSTNLRKIILGKDQ